MQQRPRHQPGGLSDGDGHEEDQVEGEEVQGDADLVPRSDGGEELRRALTDGRVQEDQRMGHEMVLRTPFRDNR